MTINASSYFRPCDCEGGLIETDTTIYLAPSASSDSPTGVIGSDVTGDGTELRPFYSIKRAMEYLEDYRIKIGVYVTIEGLEGIYRYNDSHKVEIKHKDAKYINVKFNMSYTNTTAVNGSTINVVNDSTNKKYNVTIEVNDVSGINVGDYIRSMWERWYPTKVSVDGYYKVTSVDTANKKITFEIVPYEYDDTVYSFLSTVDNDNWNIRRYKSIILLDNTNDTPFLKSNYGFGIVNMSISDINYTHDCDCLQIYDGILNDITINVSGFYVGMKLENLKITFDSNGFWSSSCWCGIYMTDCTLGQAYMSIGDGANGIICNGSYATYSDTSRRTAIHNNSWYGYVVRRASSLVTDNGTGGGWRIINCSYNNIDGFSISDGSNLFGSGLYASYNTNNGIAFTNSTGILFSNYSDVFTQCIFEHNGDNGIFIKNSDVNISWCICRYNSNNGVYGRLSNIIVDAYVSGGTTYSSYFDTNTQNGMYLIECSSSIENTTIYDNNGSGIHCTESNTLNMDNSFVYNNQGYNIYGWSNNDATINNSQISGSQAGIYFEVSCRLYITNSEVTNASNRGIVLHRGSSCYASNMNIHNNTGDGIFIYKNSSLGLQNSDVKDNTGWGVYITECSQCKINNDSGHNISGNNNGSVACAYNSNCDINTANAISGFSPSVNTTPSYTNSNGGNYILYN